MSMVGWGQVKVKVKVEMPKVSFQGEIEVSPEKRRENEIPDLKEQMLGLECEGARRPCKPSGRRAGCSWAPGSS